MKKLNLYKNLSTVFMKTVFLALPVLFSGNLAQARVSCVNTLNVIQISESEATVKQNMSDSVRNALANFLFQGKALKAEYEDYLHAAEVNNLGLYTSDILALSRLQGLPSSRGLTVFEALSRLGADLGSSRQVTDAVRMAPALKNALEFQLLKASSPAADAQKVNDVLVRAIEIFDNARDNQTGARLAPTFNQAFKKASIEANLSIDEIKTLRNNRETAEALTEALLQAQLRQGKDLKGSAEAIATAVADNKIEVILHTLLVRQLDLNLPNSLTVNQKLVEQNLINSVVGIIDQLGQDISFLRMRSPSEVFTGALKQAVLTAINTNSTQMKVTLTNLFVKTVQIREHSIANDSYSQKVISMKTAFERALAN